MTNDETLDVLLIEDNPGDVRLIEEMLGDAERLFERVGSGEHAASETRIHHESTLAAGVERCSADDVDVVLLDLGLPDSRGLETLAAVTGATEFVPIVVLTGLNDEGVGVSAIQHGAQDYLVKDEVTSDLLVRSIHYAMERNRQDRERARRREELEALNRLNELTHDVTHAVITTSTREELERAVCETLVASDAYRFAWIGEVDRPTDEITPRAAAGVEDGYLDDVTVMVEGDETADGPTGRAIRTGSVQAIQRVQTEPAYEPWREQAIERDYKSSASVPLEYDGITYGVLNVYAPSPNAFSDAEREILSRLGAVIGHAITAIERKEALVSDTVLELEFGVDDLGVDLGALSRPDDGYVSIVDLVRTDGGVLAYGRAVDVPLETFRDVVSNAPFVDELRVLSSDAGTHRFEVVTTAFDDLVDSIGSHGGQIASATITDGSLRFVVDFPPGRDKRQLVELVERHCPEATVRSQRVVERTVDDASTARSLLHASLTEKQHTALETAYYAGLFEWPRHSTGQEVADRLEVSPPTFNQHLRAAERNVFAELFADGDEAVGPGD
ncbi:GAF domain-containing protein [Halorubellus sp. JP-L1]|uniref:bacterio-opsin activator domain-containing protein n=1 Tax=Halorubellus sp. JP-L1 TaxID=2715753 RepID=UPI00140B2CDD|nr:bacterio-opsin activator domain-containing protein [Halorubellus sp. JP-L1]NHN42751.1 GAF domain-containing protein [Halorubellus sp. JP-L1]